MFKTKDIVYIGLIAAIASVLSLFELFKMPNGGSVTIYLVPLFFAAFNNDLKTNIFVAIVTATLQILLGGYILNPVQVILDYYLPVMLISTCQIYRLNKYVNLCIGALLAMCCYVVSGMIFFDVPFVPSIIYNATFFIPTLILNIVIFALINPKLSTVYLNS